MCCSNSNRASYAPISTKANALQFAILVTMDTSEGCNRVNYTEARKLYDFICQTTTFAEDEVIAAMKEATGLLNDLKESKTHNDSIESLLKAAMENANAQSDLHFAQQPPEPPRDN